MTEQTKQQIIKSYVYGMCAKDIAELYGFDFDLVAKLIADNADEIAEEKAYRAMLEGGSKHD